MFSFIIRLDDACPTMNHQKWNRMERLLDKYGVKPIVGIIPDCKDSEVDFQNEIDCDFWKKAKRWQKKGWEISQHGLNHIFHNTPLETKYFQKNIGNYTEFAGLSYNEQMDMLEKGYQILVKHGITATSFFAPAHTYDMNTVKACKDSGHFKYISDGYSLRVFNKAGMTFIPAAFDTPRKMPVGLYTFVFHPSKMDDVGFKNLENFLANNIEHLTDACSVLDGKKREQGIIGWAMENGIHFLRRLRNYG